MRALEEALEEDAESTESFVLLDARARGTETRDGQRDGSIIQDTLDRQLDLELSREMIA